MCPITVHGGARNCVWTYIPNTFVCLLCQSVCYADRTLSKTSLGKLDMFTER